MNYSRNPKVEVAPMKDESVLFNPESNKFCLLNATAAEIWNLLETPRTAEEVSMEMFKKFRNVEKSTVSEDVLRTLAELSSIGCVLSRQD